ncbi:MAG: DNA polymerase III subunit alpha [Bacteroidota bacterium]
MYLIFDTETTGLPKNYNAPLTDFDNWPRLVQLAWQLHGKNGELISAGNHIVKPDGFEIPFNSEKIHGISTKRAHEEGKPLQEVLAMFTADVAQAEWTIGHNVEFDNAIVGCEYLRCKEENVLEAKTDYDTKLEATEFCAIPGGRGGKYKWPTLTELHQKLFGVPFADAHDAAYDVDATARCFFGLLTHGVSKPLGGVAKEDITYEPPKLDAANFAKKDGAGSKLGKSVKVEDIKGPYVHLHVHTEYTILNATTNVKALVKKAAEWELPAVCMTDQGNMMGAYKFVEAANGAGIKPIVGCEFWVAEERTKTKFTKEDPDRKFQQLLIAKNKAGYHNLAFLSSRGYIEGLYGIYPRIDKELIKEYKGDVMAFTGGLGGEVPGLILNQGEAAGEEAFKWWLDLFGEDYYITLLRHGLPEEDKVNEVLMGFAEKYGVKVIASNQVHYLKQEDSTAHEILLAVKDGNKLSDPIGRGRGKRFALANDQYYYKSEAEMKKLFADVPEAIENISEILDKCEGYTLKRDVLLPEFDIPQEFVDPTDRENGTKNGENAFLRHLTYEGAAKRYGEITDDIRERLDFELATIANTGYPGYFLIVQDFTTAAREMGVSVGPGRGSAAGSAVAYCIGITNVDPIAYDLLFERFLNPDRVSLPDIDIDFDDEGRDSVIKWVVDKYGSNQVSHIITYGTMAAKSSIKDTGRVLELPLADTNEVAKMVPERPGTTLEKAFKEVGELDQLRRAQGLKADVLRQAVKLEGSIRNTGIHACGVIITPDDIRKYIPVTVAKDADLLVTQFDNSVVEDAGMLKMDFLGLKTLTIIKTAVKLIKERHGVEIITDEIPLTDEKTYELYQAGKTNGTFQFESGGMQKYLRDLKPDKFEDLIAMNALYRPGPLEYIPEFVERKHGRKQVEYDLPEMEEYLGETYGITVYQEQVMRLSQKLANFTKGEADVLRKAMGKKKKDIIDKMKPDFIERGAKNGHPKDRLEKIWKDWEAFAAYAFNKSHSTCYSVVAYHTAYLKANYPAEYMASVLTHNQNNIEKVTFFMEECRSMGIKVLGPDVNESDVIFSVNDQGEIRIGLGALKGAGEAAALSLIEERSANGPFKTFFDFIERVNLKAMNKKTMEVLAQAGAFDLFNEFHRRQYLEAPEGDVTLIEKAVKYAQKKQLEEQSAQGSLFGGDSGVAVPTPRIPEMEPYGEIQKLNLEKEVVGLFITGHPLDQFKYELKTYTNASFADMDDIPVLQGKGEVRLGGAVSDVVHRTTKNGKPFGILAMEDYSSTHSFYLFGDDYMRLKKFMEVGWFLFITGRVKNKPWGDGQLEFKIDAIDLLSEIREKRTGMLSLSVPITAVDEKLITDLMGLVEKYPGPCDLRFNVFDPEDNSGLAVELMSRKFKVAPGNELLDALEALPNVNCKIS